MVIAFIPVRGGSKSIPLKNIKPFCGKPLVCWNIEALEQCKEVDEIIVATDSDKIEEVVVSRPYKKTKNPYIMPIISAIIITMMCIANTTIILGGAPVVANNY